MRGLQRAGVRSKSCEALLREHAADAVEQQRALLEKRRTQEALKEGLRHGRFGGGRAAHPEKEQRFVEGSKGKNQEHLLNPIPAIGRMHENPHKYKEHAEEGAQERAAAYRHYGNMRAFQAQIDFDAKQW